MCLTHSITAPRHTNRVAAGARRFYKSESVCDLQNQNIAIDSANYGRICKISKINFDVDMAQHQVYLFIRLCARTWYNIKQLLKQLESVLSSAVDLLCYSILK